MTAEERDDKLAIREVIENWVIWRDSGQWEKFRTVWHEGARMHATWFQGSAADFIANAQQSWGRGGVSCHFLGGTSIEVKGARAIAQTKMKDLNANDIDNAMRLIEGSARSMGITVAE